MITIYDFMYITLYKYRSLKDVLLFSYIRIYTYFISKTVRGYRESNNFYLCSGRRAYTILSVDKFTKRKRKNQNAFV